MQDSKSGSLDASWMEYLKGEFDQPYMKTLKAFLRDEKKAGKVIYPPGSHIFNAFNATPFDQVRIVIIGQDPYHGPNQAHGLSFSVPEGVPAPPSLRNIFKEIDQEFGTQWSGQGNLMHWAKQGVLLLNAVLTVEQSQAGAHQGKGWENFTDKAISVLNEHRENIVFLLWGAYAKKKGQYIDTDRHLVLHSAHPSPLSAHRGFMGNGHFRKANDYLIACQQPPIDWSL